MLAAEYDNALSIMKKIGQHASGVENGPYRDGASDTAQPDNERKEKAALPEERPEQRENGNHEYTGAFHDSGGGAAGQSIQNSRSHTVELREHADPKDGEAMARGQEPFKNAGSRQRSGEGRIAEPGQFWRDGIVSPASDGARKGYAVRSKPTSVRAIEPPASRHRMPVIRKERTRRKPEQIEEDLLDEEQESELTLEQDLIRCPGCGAEVSARSVVCVSCGEFLRN